MGDTSKYIILWNESDFYFVLASEAAIPAVSNSVPKKAVTPRVSLLPNSAASSASSEQISVKPVRKQYYAFLSFCNFL